MSNSYLYWNLIFSFSKQFCINVMRKTQLIQVFKCIFVFDSSKTWGRRISSLRTCCRPTTHVFYFQRYLYRLIVWTYADFFLLLCAKKSLKLFQRKYYSAGDKEKMFDHTYSEFKWFYNFSSTKSKTNQTNLS